MLCFERYPVNCIQISRVNIRTLISVVFLKTIVLFSCGNLVADDKYALLVGVTKYEHSRMNASPLKYPEADAKAVAEVLQASGYKVDLLLGKQATQQAIEKTLQKAEKEGSSDGAVVLGFFGHGVQYDKTAYFCPYDSKVRIVREFSGSRHPRQGRSSATGT